MAAIRYARVSTVGQKLEVQLDELTKAGVDKTYEEKASGADGTELKAMLDYIREGDTGILQT